MSELTVRDATSDDARAIAEIHNQSIAAGGATMEEGERSAADVARKLAGLDRREALLVLEDVGEVVGWGLIKKYSPRPGYRFACETAVYVRRDRLGQGIGSRIKRALIARCRELGYHHLVAKIFAVNTASIEYNRKLGYEVVGVQREIGFKDGRWCDVVVMQLILDDVAPIDR